MPDLKEPSKADQVLRAVRLRYAQHYLDVLRSCQRLYFHKQDTDAALRLFDGEWLHILHAQAYTVECSTDKGESLHIASDYVDIPAQILDLRLQPATRLKWVETAMSAAEKSGDETAACRHLNNLGRAYSRMGEPRQAISIHQKQLELSRKLKNRRLEGAALANLAAAHANLNEDRQTVQFHEQALEIFREVGDRRLEADVLDGLGAAHTKLGDAKCAIGYCQEAVRIF